MVTVGDIVALVGRVRAIDGDNAVVVAGANGNHLLRCEDAELLKTSDLAQLPDVGTQDFLGLVRFMGAAPQSNSAASVSTDLLRLAEFDAGQLAQNLYLIGLLALYAPKGLATASGLTMNTARVLARWSASAGAIEEATVGNGLALAAGVLGLEHKPLQMQATGTSTASVANTTVSLTWGTPTIDTSSGDIAVSGSEITLNQSGIYRVTVAARTTNNNRAELILTLQENVAGAGFTDITDAIQSDYVARDSDQNTGGLEMTRLVNVANDRDKLRAQAHVDADGTSALLTAGTNIIVEGPLAAAIP